jgi:head-tail adaptor
MSFLSTTATDLVNILAADGEAIVHTDRDAVGSTNITTVIHRNGDNGSAVVNIPTASVASPLFADKIVDANTVTWYISEVQETSQGRTFCELKKSTWWKTVDIETSSNGVWSTHTASVICMIEPQQSYEELEDYGALTREFVVRMQYMATPNQRMRLKWGTRYLYITGIRPDETETRFIELDCREDEA